MSSVTGWHGQTCLSMLFEHIGILDYIALTNKVYQWHPVTRYGDG
ncbi:MAG TPA: hypothetical protein PLA96_09170 [Candidatus Brocadia sapporoensis]|nr:hypothetical protein [Candidatus Brocadia sapporoensis]